MLRTFEVIFISCLYYNTTIISKTPFSDDNIEDLKEYKFKIDEMKMSATCDISLQILRYNIKEKEAFWEKYGKWICEYSLFHPDQLIVEECKSSYTIPTHIEDRITYNGYELYVESIYPSTDCQSVRDEERCFVKDLNIERNKRYKMNKLSLFIYLLRTLNDWDFEYYGSIESYGQCKSTNKDLVNHILHLGGYEDDDIEYLTTNTDMMFM